MNYYHALIENSLKKRVNIIIRLYIDGMIIQIHVKFNHIYKMPEIKQ